MHEVHVKQVGLNEAGEIAFVADFPHEKCLSLEGDAPHDDAPCMWCDHVVTLHPEALISRMHGYCLDTLEAAFDSIVKEHALRLHHRLGADHPKLAQKDGLTPEGTSVVDTHGGLHSQIMIRHSKHRLADVLLFHNDTLEAAYQDREPRVFDTAERELGSGISDQHRALLLSA